MFLVQIFGAAFSLTMSPFGAWLFTARLVAVFPVVRPIRMEWLSARDQIESRSSALVKAFSLCISPIVSGSPNQFHCMPFLMLFARMSRFV